MLKIGPLGPVIMKNLVTLSSDKKVDPVGSGRIQIRNKDSYSSLLFHAIDKSIQLTRNQWLF